MKNLLGVALLVALLVPSAMAVNLSSNQQSRIIVTALGKSSTAKSPLAGMGFKVFVNGQHLGDGVINAEGLGTAWIGMPASRSVVKVVLANNTVKETLIPDDQFAAEQLFFEFKQ